MKYLFEVSFTKYLIAYFLGGFVILSMIFVANYVIDPKGQLIYTMKEDIKRPFLTGNRTQKSANLSEQNYDVIIAGTSRVQVGFSPYNVAFKDMAAYNLGLAATNMCELYEVLNFVIKNQDIKIIIFGLDFYTFSNRGIRTVNNDFHGSLFNSERGYYYNIFRYLLSIKTFGHTLITAYSNMVGREIVSHDKRGFYDRSGRKVNHRELFNDTISLFSVDSEKYAEFVYGEDREVLFQDILEKFSKNRTKIILLFPPVHAVQLEILFALDLFELFAKWERRVVEISASVSKKYHKEIAVWDFGGYNSITTERIPSIDEPDKQMKWYWDPSHFKKETGDMVICRILNFHDQADTPGDFGVKLYMSNIDSHLQKIRDGHELYKKAFPFEVNEVVRLVKDPQKNGYPSAKTANAGFEIH